MHPNQLPVYSLGTWEIGSLVELTLQYMAPCRCFENQVPFNVSRGVIVDRIDVAFPGCQAHSGFHILNPLSTLCKTRDELSEGRHRTGSLRNLPIHTHTHTLSLSLSQTHTHTHTHTHTYIPVSRIKKQIWNHGGHFYLIDSGFVLPGNTELVWLHTLGSEIGDGGYWKFYDGWSYFLNSPWAF